MNDTLETWAFNFMLIHNLIKLIYYLKKGKGILSLQNREESSCSSLSGLSYFKMILFFSYRLIRKI